MNDGKVEQVMEEVLRRLSEGEGLTISPVKEHEYLLSIDDILRDLEIFADEVFDADVAKAGTRLTVAFRNGQTFRLTVEEEV